MSRTTTQWVLFAAMALASLGTTACTHSDATGPSDQPAPSFEAQGSNT